MKKILFQFDTDAHASSFDAVTAIDSGVDHLLQHAHCNCTNVTPLVQGGVFTRGPKDLKNTAIFVGGSDVEAAETIFQKVQESFFGPLRVSVMLDANGCNTTASAAVTYIRQHVELSQVRALVLGGTGPVGRRVAELLAWQGAEVTVVSRNLNKARKVCSQIQEISVPPVPAELPVTNDYSALMAEKNVVVATGAAGIEFLSVDDLAGYPELKLAIDLNAVPPLGINGIASTDKARTVGNLLCYGAVGIGGRKMKIHRALIQQLFVDNAQIFDTRQIYEFAANLD